MNYKIARRARHLSCRNYPGHPPNTPEHLPSRSPVGPLATFWHLSSFVAPAAAVALAVALAGRFLLPRGESGGWRAQAAINMVAGTGALAVGLWWFGVDGKMATYGALAAAVATSQWICSRAWRH